MTPELRASYAACRRVHRRHDPTYYFATRRLPAEVRPAVHALYAFVRSADELVDGPARAADPAARRAALDGLEGGLRAGLA
ncbi:MAG: squalene/phytoene synthase family protein, partial [Thermoleophilaceae bacterium]